MNLVPIVMAVAGLHAEARPVATYRDGVVVQQDLDSWYLFLQAEGRALRRPALGQQVEQIVALRTLSRRFESEPPAVRREGERRYRLWRLDLAEKRLRDSMRTQAAPSEAEIRAIFEADPQAYAEPRSWVLENILKRYPDQASPEDRQRVRAAMEAVRRRALAGEDFAKLAREESESQTRLRGGSFGAPYLSQLAPPVAEVVSKLKAGDVSEVFAVPGGLALLHCSKVLEPKEATLEDARPRIARPRGEERFQKAWAQLVDRVQADLAPVLRPEAALTAAAEDPVASFRDGSSRRDLTRAELDLFLGERRLDARALTAEQLKEQIAQRVRLEGLYREAEARGLLRQEGDEARFRWKEMELRAQAVAGALPVAEPTEEEMKAAFEARRAEFVAPPQSRLEALRLVISPERPREVYEEARKLGERLAAGAMSFEEAARALPQAERVDLGWLDDDQVWLLGLNVDTAVKAAPAGGSTPLVQEGRLLFLVHVLAKEPERRRSFEEARDAVRLVLRAEARQRAADDLRRRVVDEERVVTEP